MPAVPSHRWRPPPGWPTPPPGWFPWFGWKPDPSWPEPPDGWVWWLRPPMPKKSAVALTLAAVALLAALVVMFTPVHTSVSGRRVDCGDSVWAFFPVDPGADLAGFDACASARGPATVAMLGLGVGSAGLVTFGLGAWHRSSREWDARTY